MREKTDRSIPMFKHKPSTSTEVAGASGHIPEAAISPILMSPIPGKPNTFGSQKTSGSDFDSRSDISMSPHHQTMDRSRKVEKGQKKVRIMANGRTTPSSTAS